jgi:mRNA interferase RelE/StbE
MDTYCIDWKPSALRELKNLDRQVIPNVVTEIEALASNPFPHGVQKLHGSDSIYRIRIGDYRAVYEVITTAHSLEVLRVRHRKDVYR